MSGWSQDWARADRMLFLRDSAAYRWQRVRSVVFCERTLWYAVLSCCAYVAARML